MRCRPLVIRRERPIVRLERCASDWTSAAVVATTAWDDTTPRAWLRDMTTGEAERNFTRKRIVSEAAPAGCVNTGLVSREPALTVVKDSENAARMPIRQERSGLITGSHER